jgi:beta-glucosidase
MRTKRQYILLFELLFCVALSAQNSSVRFGKSSVDEVVEALTLKEKASIVVGAGMIMPAGDTDIPLMGVTDNKVKVPGTAGTTQAVERLGIPSLTFADGPAGIRLDSVRSDKPGKTYYATAFPAATLLASSWDTDLVKKVGSAFGNEVKEYGTDVILAPGMNIQRNPLCGRNFEYYSEDPLVSGKMGAAMVNGLQSAGIGTSVKHYALNNQETDRHLVNSIASERAIREIYLRGFEIAVKESNPWTIMSAFNLVNGTYAAENYDLLTAILRKEWGFQGFVMTDWGGGKNPVEMMKAGNDLLMPGMKSQEKKIVAAVKDGTLDEKVLDENVKHILNIILISPTFHNYKYSDAPNLEAGAEIAHDVAAEGMVLLKNEAALPLSSGNKISLFGINGYELICGGQGSAGLNKAYTVSLLEGLKNTGYAIDSKLQSVYKTYLKEQKAAQPVKTTMQEFINPTPPIEEQNIGKEIITAQAQSNDIALISIGRNSGEGRDRTIKNDYEFSETELTLIKNVSQAFHATNKQVIVVLNIGGVIDVTAWRDNVDAILLAWQPGMESGNAMADILSGKVNPSGKLAVTFPLSYSDVPAQNFPSKEDSKAKGKRSQKTQIYDEDIYVGYRYFLTKNVKTAYEFGYGLSYTQFKYSDLKVEKPSTDGMVKVSVVVKNVGKVAGKEAAQLYLAAPTTSLEKPVYELKAFSKTALLQPGKSETLTFTLTNKELSSFVAEKSAWIADAGEYTVKIGTSCLDIRLEKKFTLPKDITAEKTNKMKNDKIIENI